MIPSPVKLPLIVAAIIVPIVAGFYVGGAGVGTAMGALTVVAIIVYAARMTPEGTIEAPAAGDGRRHVLLVVTSALEEPAAVASVIAAASLAGQGLAEVLVLVPAQLSFLDRWASDVEGSRQAAQDRLVATVAALAKAGVRAEARVGDEALVQAVEDRLQTYPATEVVLVTDHDGAEEERDEIEELSRRLGPEFRHLELESA